MRAVEILVVERAVGRLEETVMAAMARIMVLEVVRQEVTAMEVSELLVMELVAK
jgi:hypothetical protein